MHSEIVFISKNKIIKQSLILSITLIFLMIIIAVWKWHRLPPQLPLFYSLPRGSSQLGILLQLFILPVFSFTSIIINYTLSVFLFKRDTVASQLLIVSATVFTVIMCIAFVKIIFLVT